MKSQFPFVLCLFCGILCFMSIKNQGFYVLGNFYIDGKSYFGGFLSSLILTCWVGEIVFKLVGSIHGAEIVTELVFVRKFCIVRANFRETVLLPSEFRWRPCLMKCFLSNSNSSTFTCACGFIILFNFLLNLDTS